MRSAKVTTWMTFSFHLGVCCSQYEHIVCMKYVLSMKY